MRSNHRAIATFFAVLCVAMLYPYATGRAELPQDRTIQDAAHIPFQDPAHSHFFKYQIYLIQQGKVGETLETWNALPGPERAHRVSTGESLLKQLYFELSGKSVLSAEEAHLFRTFSPRQ